MNRMNASTALRTALSWLRGRLKPPEQHTDWVEYSKQTAWRSTPRLLPPPQPQPPSTYEPPEKQPVTSVVPYVPGVKLDEYRAKRGLKTIKLEPFPWLEDDSWLNSGLLPIPKADVQVSPIYEPPEVETEHMPAFVRALHEKQHEGRGKAS